MNDSKRKQNELRKRQINLLKSIATTIWYEFSDKKLINQLTDRLSPDRMLLELGLDGRFTDTSLELPLEVLELEVSVLEAFGRLRYRRGRSPFRESRLESFFGRDEEDPLGGLLVLADVQLPTQEVGAAFLVLLAHLAERIARLGWVTGEKNNKALSWDAEK